jgi:transcriptional regulator
MYLPKIYQETDPDVIDDFIRRNEFGILVSTDADAPVATHLPLELAVDPDGERRLLGHMARANPQWRTFSAERPVLVIFAGPHTYISPRWYGHVNVPTWNYLTVHVYGRPHLIDDPIELRALLTRLVDRHEAEPGTYRLDALPEDFVRKQMQAVAGFAIAIERIEAKSKLSQNRERADFENVITELGRRPDADSHAVAAEMERLHGRLFAESSEH